MILTYVTHDITNNTLEATWLEEVDGVLKRVKCHNYSEPQKAEFLADCGTDGQKYVDMANWA